MEDKLIHLDIISREGILFKDEVVSVTCYSDKGEFDILPLHANFISLIYKKIIIVKRDGGKVEFNINKAILRNIKNRLEIFLGVESYGKDLRKFSS